MFADNERHKNDGSSSGIKLFVVVLAILLGIAFLVSTWLFSEDIEFSLLIVTLLYGVVMPNALVIASLYDKDWKKHEHKRIFCYVFMTVVFIAAFFAEEIADALGLTRDEYSIGPTPSLYTVISIIAMLVCFFMAFTMWGKTACRSKDLYDRATNTQRQDADISARKRSYAIVKLLVVFALIAFSVWDLFNLCFVCTSEYNEYSIIALLCGLVLPDFIIIASLYDVQRRSHALKRVICAVLIAISFVVVFYGESIAAWLEIPMVSYAFNIGKDVEAALSIVAMLVCAGIALAIWGKALMTDSRQHLRQQSRQ